MTWLHKTFYLLACAALLAAPGGYSSTPDEAAADWPERVAHWRQELRSAESSADAIALLRQLLGSESTRVQRRVLSTFAALRPADAELSRELIRAIPTLRAETSSVVIHLFATRPLPPVKRSFYDLYPLLSDAERLAYLEVARQAGDSSWLTLLFTIATSEKPVLAAKAKEALSWLGGADASHQLLRIVNARNASQAERQLAAETLFQRGDLAFKPRMLDLIATPDDPLREWAARHIRHWGTAEDLPALLRVMGLPDTPESVAQSIARSVNAIVANRVDPASTDALQIIAQAKQTAHPQALPLFQALERQVANRNPEN